LKVHHQLTKHVSLTGGVDSVVDETYAISNTYKDLTLLLDGTGDVMLMGKVVEHRLTQDLFVTPDKKETADYIEGRYG